MSGLFKTSLDLSSFVWYKLTGLFKTSLDLSSICLIIRQVSFKEIKEGKEMNKA